MMVATRSPLSVSSIAPVSPDSFVHSNRWLGTTGHAAPPRLRWSIGPWDLRSTTISSGGRRPSWSVREVDAFEPNQLAANAVRKGLTAVCLQTQTPLAAFELLLRRGWRVIVNHLVGGTAPWGHFSVVQHVNASHVTLHDPQAGPNQRYTHAEFRRRWLPASLHSEVTGGVLAAIRWPKAAESNAAESNAAEPRVADRCPRCDQFFPLPAEWA